MINPVEEISRLVTWLREQVNAAGARGLVVGISGGIDSAVVAALARRALPDSCLALVMPCHSDPRDAQDALAVARYLALPVEIRDLSPAYDAVLQVLGCQAGPVGHDIPAANIKPRLRMITLYYEASRRGYLVAGTGNLSELTVGYFTKYGDGGVDVLPIAHLVKSQVLQLAEELGLPEAILTRPPSAGLWEGQTDEGEMGLTYKELDAYILTGQAEPAVMKRIESLRAASGHKRNLPSVPTT